ncbi:MAG TPA: ornithine cyclodeaminase family protein [Pseudonocardiaceae bacterium]|nr:ornithine cyclodeaminase family protein [Pseudonocardiaceae bacterium]
MAEDETAALAVLGAAEVSAALPMPTAIAAIRAALLDGLDPAADPPRSVVPVRHGQLLLMPAQWGGFAGVKVASVAPGNPRVGLPRIQGNYLLLDGPTLTPVALLDGGALTAIRTAAVSAVAVDALSEPDSASLVVFGSGPQARSHVEAIRAVRPIERVSVVGRDGARAAAFAASCDGRVGTAADVATADIVACCTTARTPLFDGTLVRGHTTVVAVGSHEPDAAEVDAATVAGSVVVVEAVETALREAGDVVQAVTAGLLDPATLIDLATAVREPVDRSRPRLFKSVGMAWEDLVLAAAAYQAR